MGDFWGHFWGDFGSHWPTLQPPVMKELSFFEPLLQEHITISTLEIFANPPPLLLSWWFVLSLGPFFHPPLRLWTRWQRSTSPPPPEPEDTALDSEGQYYAREVPRDNLASVHMLNFHNHGVKKMLYGRGPCRLPFTWNKTGSNRFPLQVIWPSVIWVGHLKTKFAKSAVSFPRTCSSNGVT